MQKRIAEKYGTEVDRYRRIYRDLSKMRIFDDEEKMSYLSLTKGITRNTKDLDELDILIKHLDNKLVDAESQKFVETITSILVQQDGLNDEIEAFKTKNEHLKSQIRLVDDQLKKYSTIDIQFNANKKTEILENRLLHNNQKLSCLKMDGLRFKEVVSHLLLARRRFNRIRDDFIAKLMGKKQRIVELVDHYAIGFSRGMKSCHDLEKCRIQTAEQLKEHLQEMRRLIRYAESNSLLREFTVTKGENIDLKSYALPPREILMTNYRTAIKAYEELLGHLNDFAPGVTLQDIREKIRLSFSVYLYVNDIQKMIDDSEKVLSKLNDEYEIAAQQATIWQQIKDKLNDLENAYIQATENTQDRVKRQQEQKTKLKGHYKNVEELFKMLKCEDSLLYSSGQEINAHNLDDVLQVIEKRLRHVMHTVFCWEEKQSIPADKRLVPAVEIERASIVPDVNLVHQCAECSQVEARANPEFETILDEKDKYNNIKKSIKNKALFAKMHAIEECPKPESKAILSKEM